MLTRGISEAGQEVFETILKRVVTDQGKFIIVLSGYKNEMKDFLDSNPGA